MRILGIDPGLVNTGWGVIEAEGGHLRYVADGTIRPPRTGSLAERLMALHAELVEVIKAWIPDEAAVEETFVNKNPLSALKLGHARGIALLAPAEAGLAVSEYPANLIKKSVVGAGHAEKEQVQMMVKMLMPGCTFASADSADALAVAICHAHHSATKRLVGGIMAGAAR